MSHLSYVEALAVGALQGVTELFPVSSLGHAILVPALVGDRWAEDLDVAAPRSPYLAFLVGVHVATALALVVFYWRDWRALILGLVSSIRHRRIDGPTERLAWMLILATVPVGVVGLLLDHALRTTVGRPVPAAVFLIVNGAILFGAERLRRRTPDDSATDARADSDGRLAAVPLGRAVLIGSAQALALLPGISRSGATMVAGLLRGLSHEDAARFSFLLATPVILAAGVLKTPELLGEAGDGIRGQVLAGSVVAFVAAYLAVRFLTRYFETRTLTPFAVYCALLGVGGLVLLTG